MSTSSSAETDKPAAYDWAGPWYAGKRVLVTGGTSGIGLAIARAFGAAGASVTAVGVNQSEIDALASTSGLHDLRLLDVRDGAAIDELMSGMDGLDIVINCAGIIRREEEHDPAVFAQVIDINLNGTMRVCSAARPLLAASGVGAIVNLASMLSIFGGGLVPAYSASKGGISQLTKSLAIAYAADNIRVNAVAPGWISTPLTSALRADPGRSGAILSRTPLNRWGQPDDIAGAALFLCSPAAGFITGTTLAIDGGYSIS
jgi:NAD(P)-dependent dehydrogenase (short-subunit alcohol dehydrogenase family)